MKETVSEEDINSILPMIENLTLGSDNRLECELRIRSLKKKSKSSLLVVKRDSKKTVIGREQILQIVNHSNDFNEVDVALIELNEKEYINLGREGRLSVVKQLVQSTNIYQTEKELVEDLQAKAKRLYYLLDTINGIKDRLEFIEVLEEMKLPMYLSLSKEIKEIIIDYLIHQYTTFKSISSLANAIEKGYLSMDIFTASLSVDNRFEKKLIKI